MAEEDPQVEATNAVADSLSRIAGALEKIATNGLNIRFGWGVPDLRLKLRLDDATTLQLTGRFGDPLQVQTVPPKTTGETKIDLLDKALSEEASDDIE